MVAFLTGVCSFISNCLIVRALRVINKCVPSADDTKSSVNVLLHTALLS